MNGYSVKKAAEVLGIPKARVWELIARGVLAGANEAGGSMRVYLGGSVQPSPVTSPAPEAPPHAEGNGNGANGANHGELSPFRELLTEFRNLTERYGQALLALGEARGEVAALRSRVDLLEARIDLRLPMRAASTVAWEMPAQPPRPSAAHAEAAAPEAAAPEAAASQVPPGPEPAAEPPAPAPAEPSVGLTGAAEGPITPPGGRSRRYGTREAVAGLAEALARAEDPTLSSLPGASEAAEALAALQQQVEASEPQGVEPSEPAVPTPDESAPTTPDEPRLTPFADELSEGEDLAMAAELDDLTAVAPSIELVEEEVAPEAVAADVLMAVDVRADAEAADVAEPVEAAEAPPEAPASPYTTDVIEPDWFADGDFAWLESPSPEPEAPSEPEASAATDVMAGPGREPMEPSDRAAEAPLVNGAEAGADTDGELSPAAEPWPAAAQEPFPEQSAADEIQEAFEDAGPSAEAAEPMPSVEPVPSVMEESVADEIQEAFEDAGTTRAEAIPIEPNEPGPASREDGPPSFEPRADAGPPSSSFGLYRGQPEGPIEAAGGVRPATAVRDEEAVMWLGDDFEAGDLELATPGWRDGGAAPPPTPILPAPLQLSDAEIEQLANSEGWDDEEVSAIRGLLGRLESVPEPAAASQDEAARSEPVIPADDSPAIATPAHRAIPIRPANAGPEGADWLRGRRGPAASAYRRLRRIFQG